MTSQVSLQWIKKTIFSLIGLIATEEETEPASVAAMDESDTAKASTTLAQAAMGQVEVHGVQSGVSRLTKSQTTFHKMERQHWNTLILRVHNFY